MNLLFICSRNKWRSRTAENIFKNLNGVEVRSAGTAASARIKINEALILWADLIFVMENKHKQRLKGKFHSALTWTEIVVLGIPDKYQYMDDELVKLLTESVSTRVNL